MVDFSHDVSIRRVRFRSGTDAELTALHAVEAPVGVEIRSNRMPQPIEAYISYREACLHNSMTMPGSPRPPTARQLPADFVGPTRRATHTSCSATCRCVATGDGRVSGPGSSRGSSPRRPTKADACSRGRPSTARRPGRPFLVGSALSRRESTSPASCVSPISTGG